MREHQKAHENSQTTSQSTATTTTVTNTTILNKSDFITLFDCQTCGNLFASEQDLKKHSCSTNSNINFGIKTKKTSKSNSNKSTTTLKKTTTTSTKSKPKSNNVNTTLTTAVLGDSDQIMSKDSSNSEFTFQFHEGLVDDNIPTAHIEIITAPVDIGGSFPPIVTIDGIQYPTIPILTNSIGSDVDDNDTNNGKEELSTKLLLTTIPSLK